MLGMSLCFEALHNGYLLYKLPERHDPRKTSSTPRCSRLLLSSLDTIQEYNKRYTIQNIETVLKGSYRGGLKDEVQSNVCKVGTVLPDVNIGQNFYRFYKVYMSHKL